MIKLTRLNGKLVALNPDLILWADATPDTTLCLVSGEKLLVRQTLDELIALVVTFRRSIRRRVVHNKPSTPTRSDRAS